MILDLSVSLWSGHLKEAGPHTPGPHYPGVHTPSQPHFWSQGGGWCSLCVWTFGPRLLTLFGRWNCSRGSWSLGAGPWLLQSHHTSCVLSVSCSAKMWGGEGPTLRPLLRPQGLLLRCLLLHGRLCPLEFRPKETRKLLHFGHLDKAERKIKYSVLGFYFWIWFSF